MDVKYQIFISSTYEDLKEERQTIVQSILKHYNFPIGMEMFSAEDEEQWEIIKSTIDSSDIYVLLVGHRYGSLTKEKISFTEKEFNYALQRKKAGKIKILCFLRQDNVEISTNKLEKNKTIQAKLNKFKQRIRKSNIMIDFWDYKGKLAEVFSPALSKTIRRLNDKPEKSAGWVKLDSIANKLSEVEHLQNIKNVMFESSREYKTTIEETESYTFDNTGSCTIVRERTLECGCDMSFSFTQYISDKNGEDSRIIDIIDLNSGAKLNHLIHRNERNSFSFFVLFEKQIKSGKAISFRTTTYVQYYLSDLIDKNIGSIKYEPFANTCFKSKTDIFSFKNIQKFKNLRVILKIAQGNKIICTEINPEIVKRNKIYKVKYPAKAWKSKFSVEFSIVN